MKFLDTNILVYAADETDSAKFGTACGIIACAIQGKGYVISAQVINEFTSLMLRKFKRPVEELEELLSVLSEIRTVPVLPEWTTEALEVMRQYNLQFYDSLLIVAARATGCDEFVSEDLNNVQLYCGIRAVNPFS